MSIWARDYQLVELNRRGDNTLASFLGIEIIEIGDDFLLAQMPIIEKVKQPLGIVHGGANVVLAETVASTAANMCVDLTQFYCVGLEINTNHLRSKREGVLFARARAYHLGRTTQVWEIEIHDENKVLTAISRMTAAVLKRA